MQVDDEEPMEDRSDEDAAALEIIRQMYDIPMSGDDIMQNLNENYEMDVVQFLELSTDEQDEIMAGFVEGIVGDIEGDVDEALEHLPNMTEEIRSKISKWIFHNYGTSYDHDKVKDYIKEYSKELKMPDEVREKSLIQVLRDEFEPNSYALLQPFIDFVFQYYGEFNMDSLDEYIQNWNQRNAMSAEDTSLRRN